MGKTRAAATLAAMAALVAGCQTASTPAARSTATSSEGASTATNWDDAKVALAGEPFELYWDSDFSPESCEVAAVPTLAQHLERARIEGPAHGSLTDGGVAERETGNSGCTVEARVVSYVADAGYTGPDSVRVFWDEDGEPMERQLQVFADYATLGQTVFPYAHPSERPIADSPPPAAAFAPPPTGFSFVEVDKNGEAERWTLTQSGPEWTIASDRGTTMASTGPFLIATGMTTPSYTLEQTYDADAGFLFPLSTGTSATAGYGGSRSTGESWQGSARVCSVLGAYAIDIPAGSFDTYKVQCISGGAWLPHGMANLPYRSEVFYYAPAVGLSVVSARETRDGDSDVSIWTGYTAPPGT